jgi:hypothetical protein
MRLLFCARAGAPQGDPRQGQEDLKVGQAFTAIESVRRKSNAFAL